MAFSFALGERVTLKSSTRTDLSKEFGHMPCMSEPWIIIAQQFHKGDPAYTIRIVRNDMLERRGNGTYILKRELMGPAESGLGMQVLWQNTTSSSAGGALNAVVLGGVKGEIQLVDEGDLKLYVDN